jgi:arginase family enzyme
VPADEERRAFVDRESLERAYQRAESRDAETGGGGVSGYEPYVAPGVLSFMEVPYRPLGTPLEADVAIVGMPFEAMIIRDAFVVYDRHMAPPPDPDSALCRSGAYDAPNAIRVGSGVYSARVGGVMPEHDGLRLGDALSIVDVGDAPVRTGTSEEAWEAGAEAVRSVVAAGAVPVTLGGDHTTTGIVLEGIFRAKPDLKLGAIVLDSHYDMWRQPRIDPGSFWYRAFENGILDPSNLAQIGLRGTRNPASFKSAADELGVTCFSMRDVDRHGIAAIAERALEVACSGVDALYVSLDVDVIDPAFCPGQKYPDAAGLTAREVVTAINTLIGGATTEIAGYDVVCFSPYYDLRHHGAMCVARSIVEFIATLATRRAAA